MKKYYLSLLLSIQASIPSMDEYKFAESDRTIDVILINLSLLKDNMFLVNIAIGVFLGLLIIFYDKVCSPIHIARKSDGRYC